MRIRHSHYSDQSIAQMHRGTLGVATQRIWSILSEERHQLLLTKHRATNSPHTTHTQLEEYRGWVLDNQMSQGHDSRFEGLQRCLLHGYHVLVNRHSRRTGNNGHRHGLHPAAPVRMQPRAQWCTNHSLP